MNLHNDILESIGNTPMVKVNNIDTGKCDLLLKLEMHFYFLHMQLFHTYFSLFFQISIFYSK